MKDKPVWDSLSQLFQMPSYTPLLPKDLLKMAGKLTKEEARKVIDHELSKPRPKHGWVISAFGNAIANQLNQPSPWIGGMPSSPSMPMPSDPFMTGTFPPNMGGTISNVSGFPSSNFTTSNITYYS